MNDLTLPDFLDRKLNGIVAEQKAPSNVRRQAQRLVWPKKRNWRKIEQRRRELEKREGAALLAGAFIKRKGQ
jgi:hypothetical protein